MENPRLYYGPKVTKSVLRHVIKGATTREELAEKLNCGERTVYNKVHDPKILGFLKREDGEYVITDKDELMGLFQLDKREVLKERFMQLPGVEEVDDKLNGGSMSFIDVGRIVAYYTDSEAIDEDAFQTYGRVYANWFHYFGKGYAVNSTLYRNKPPGVEKTSSGGKTTGSGYPKVSPDTVFEALPIIRGGVGGKSELASHFDFSDRHAEKILSTCYSLNLAERDKEITLTEFGKQVVDASMNDRQRLIREALLDVELVKRYCELAPDSPFKNQELMEKVGEDLERDWSDSTVQTKAKRIYRWLVYSGLFTEVKQGTLVPTSEVGGDLSSINDYV